MCDVYKGKRIVVTGGTGSFGKEFLKTAIKLYEPQAIVIFSRDEMKQWELQKLYSNIDDRIRFFIGDVRDKDRLKRAFTDADFVIHAAATKIVPTSEYDPFECVKTNVMGAMNVIDAAIDTNVKKVVALSTDKASSPINLYGATKLTSDKLFVSANNYSQPNGTRFSVVRYGNVMGSRGSVIPFFHSIKSTNKFPITDKRMTRFMITLEQGIELVKTAFRDALGGEIFVKKIPSMRVVDIARAINPNAKLQEIGIRLGEKLHEQMISFEDAKTTYEFDDHYRILPAINNWHQDKDRINGGKAVNSSFVYTSENNIDWMSIEELSDWVAQNLKS